MYISSLVTSQAKIPRAHPRQSHVPNLQLPAVLPAHILSRTLHHPANPCTLPYPPPMSPFLDLRSLIISCTPIEPYPSLHHVFEMTYYLNLRATKGSGTHPLRFFRYHTFCIWNRILTF